MYRFAVSLLVLVAMAACGGSSGTTTASTPVPTPVPTPTPLSFPMAGTGAANSGITGTVSVTKASGAFTLVVSLKGLAPSSSHISHIHKGSCAANGPIAVALSQVIADSSGSATATTTLNQDYLVPSEGWYANVHTGPDLQGANAKGLACGDLK